jgi:hypothetical protein
MHCLSCVGKHPEATLGQWLKAYRLAAGLTLQCLSQLTGGSAQLLGN